MGWLSRRKGAPEDDRPDEALTFFTRAQADRFRGLVYRHLAERGVEAVVHPDHVVTEGGREWGLWNVAAVAHDAERGEADWPAVIANHFDKTPGLLAPEPAESDEATFRSQLHARLVEEAMTEDVRIGFAYADHWAPGLAVVLTEDQPDSVQTLGDGTLAKRGAIDELWELGRRNLAALVQSEDLVKERLDVDGHWVQVVLGDSFYTGSFALFLPELVHRFEPDISLDEGVVFAVPNRHQVCYRVVDGADSVLAALMVIPRFAAHVFSDSAGPVSPDTYLWKNGSVTRVSRIEDGRVSVRPGPDLEPYLTEAG